MQFYEVLAQVIELLQRQGRVSYRALKRQFDLDNDYLEDLKAEIIKAKRLAVDEDGDVLVWTGSTALPAASGPATDPERTPLSYTPSHLTEKILEARVSLEGERKQVTALFADLKGSMELLADRREEAHTFAERALTLARAHQERSNEAYALRLLGDIAARREPPESESAEAHYRQALVLANELGMRPLIAHCYRGLGTLYAKIGRREQARPNSPSPSTCTAPWR